MILKGLIFNMKASETCPNCRGTSGYEFKDPAIFVMRGEWGKGAASEECVDTEHKTNPPVYCFCIDCKTKFKISKARKNEGPVPG